MAESAQDKDMLDMVTTELDQAINEEKRLHNLLLKTILPKDDADERDCILEVRAGIKSHRPQYLLYRHFCILFLLLSYFLVFDKL